jgi:hypothetical protein
MNLNPLFSRDYRNLLISGVVRWVKRRALGAHFLLTVITRPIILRSTPEQSL